MKTVCPWLCCVISFGSHGIHHADLLWTILKSEMIFSSILFLLISSHNEFQSMQGVDAQDLIVRKEKTLPEPGPKGLTVGHTSTGVQTTGLGAAFNREKKQIAAQDIEREMYIEMEVARRMGRQIEEGVENAANYNKKTIEELALESVAPKQKLESPEELGAAFVAGVAEVELGIDHKLRNIESTEAAKAALLGKGIGSAEDLGLHMVGDDNDDYFSGSRKAASKIPRAHFPARFGKQRFSGKETTAPKGRKY